MNSMTGEPEGDSEAPPPGRNGWWFVFLCLPFAVFVQIATLLSLSREGAAMTNAALCIDGLIALRGLIGLMWQQRSGDWWVYCVFQFACIPLLWFILGLSRTRF